MNWDFNLNLGYRYKLCNLGKLPVTNVDLDQGMSSGPDKVRTNPNQNLR